MIKVKNELEFVIKTCKAFVNFKIKKFFFKLFFGHFILKKKIIKNIPNNISKIQLGSSFKINNFFNTEIFSKYPIDIVNKLPFDNESIDVVFSSHVVEHIHLNEFKFFLKDSYRILKAKGSNVIATPSLEKIAKISFGDDNEIKELLFSRQDKWIGKYPKTAAMQINLTMRNFGHRFIYDLETIDKIAKEVGFTKVESVDVRNLKDKDIQNFIIDTKPALWFAETEIFVLTK